MLFQLDKMRESEEYNMELAPSSMFSLSEMFLPRPEWSLAAQDWFSLANRFTIKMTIQRSSVGQLTRFSLLSWAKPHLVASLPCKYNVLLCSTVAFAKDAKFSNIPCGEEIAIAHFCGNEINV